MLSIISKVTFHFSPFCAIYQETDDCGGGPGQKNVQKVSRII